MKKNLAVLVLLVTWSILSISSLTSVAIAGSDAGVVEKPVRSEPIVEVNGAGDDDTGGDPGDAGDGYGIAEQGSQGDSEAWGKSIIDEYLLILMSIVQLVL